MANMLSWVKAGGFDEDISIKCTSEKYAEIKGMNLETVKWKLYTSTDLLPALHEIKNFIDQYKPCLFIYDPRTSEVKKDFLKNVNDIDSVYLWINRNFNDVKNYDYLITSQIDNPGDGFVGTVFSDGRGSLVCETLHTPTVSIHRELSQPKKEFPEGALNKLYMECDEINDIWSVMGKHLTRRDILEIQELYMPRRGYFEFVQGVQVGGKRGMYTTGYESRGAFDIKDLWHKTGCIDTTYRLNGTLLKNGMR